MSSDSPSERDRLDRDLHERLLKIGRDLPEPVVSDDVRSRIRGLLRGREAEPSAPSSALERERRRAFRLQAAFYAAAACAAVLAVVAGVLFIRSNQLRHELAVLRSAGGGPTGVERVDSPVSGRGPRYVLVNLHHEFCPFAQRMTPQFRRLADRHLEDPVLFVTLDVSEPNRSQAVALAEALGLGCVFEKAPGSETGVVKMIDAKRHEVLAAATVVSGLGPIEEMLAGGLEDPDSP